MSVEQSGFNRGHVRVANVYENVDQDVVCITEDKLKNILRDYTEIQENRKPWMGVLGILVTLAVTFLSSEPNGVLLPKEYWYVVIVVSTMVVFPCFVYYTFKAWTAWRDPMAKLDGVLRRIKGNSHLRSPHGAVPRQQQQQLTPGAERVADSEVLKLGGEGD